MRKGNYSVTISWPAGKSPNEWTDVDENTRVSIDVGERYEIVIQNLSHQDGTYEVLLDGRLITPTSSEKIAAGQEVVVKESEVGQGWPLIAGYYPFHLIPLFHKSDCRVVVYCRNGNGEEERFEIYVSLKLYVTQRVPAGAT